MLTKLPAATAVAWQLTRRHFAAQAATTTATAATAAATQTMTAEASKWNYRALDTQTLEYLSESLAAGPKVSQFRFPEGARDAAVLLPLCLPSPAEGSSESILPSVLFTLRSSNLNSHQGEVSFPGGKRDPGDVHLSDTVLRETLEETSLAPNSVRLLGPMSAVPAKNPMLRIHPFVGFVYNSDGGVNYQTGRSQSQQQQQQQQIQPQQPPLPTLDISQLMFNPSEVDRIFTVSLLDLTNPLLRISARDLQNPHESTLRLIEVCKDMDGLDSSTVDAEVIERRNVALADPTVRDIVARSQKRGSPVIVTRDGHTIWGLTAFVLHRFLTLVS